MRRNADLRARLTMRAQCLQQSFIAVGRFDKNLCLLFLFGALLQLANAGSTFGGIRRQVAIECKILSTQSTAHQGQQN